MSEIEARPTRVPSPYGAEIRDKGKGEAAEVGTFQGLSYVIDVYRGDGRVQKSLVNVCLYISFFPQLIAGPIVKYRDVSNQLHVYKHRYTLSQIEEGMTLFTFGLAKKVLLADAIGALWTDIIQVAHSTSCKQLFAYS